MNEQQAEEIIRQLKRVNSNLMGVGLLLFGLLVVVVVIAFVLWKASNLRL